MPEKEYLYFLCQIPGIGAISIFRLREFFGGFREIWNAEERFLRKANILTERRLSKLLEGRKQESAFQREYEALEGRGIRFTAYWEEAYPQRLRPYRDRPAALYLKGAFPKDGLPSVAIVGARGCTEYGKEAAGFFASSLAKENVQIISGLALGVDGAAHRGALAAGGRTFAVLGCGINVCYPKENYGLFCEMEEKGGLITEFPLGTRPSSMNFPMRNRIISALADAVIITDGQCRVSYEFSEKFREQKLKSRVTVTGILLDKTSDCGESLIPFCDKIYRTSKLSEEEIALEVLGGKS